MKISLGFILVLSLLFSGCVFSNIDNIKPSDSIMDWSINLFREGFEDDENYLISPMSVLIALSMTANGADGETLLQMEKTLGESINTINEKILSYTEVVKDVSIANSIWINNKDYIEFIPEFIEINSKYYNTKVNKEIFNNRTAEKINNWVNKNTKGMIPGIIDNIHPDSIMYLINAIAFDMEWDEKYEEEHVKDEFFTDHNNSKKKVGMMYSQEKLYINDEEAIGFIKPYKDGKFNFIAIRPNKDLTKYIEGMTGESFQSLINSQNTAEVDSYLPKFTYEYGIEMSDLLIKLGMKDAFNKNRADFSKMAIIENENVYINKINHKTFIEVNEKGTKAAAATSVEMLRTASVFQEERYIVKLDKPFIFIIADSKTNLPLFIGAVLSI